MANNDGLNDDINDDIKHMMLLFKQILIYLLAILREKQQHDIMANAMRNHSTIFAHFTNEADAKKTEAGYDAKKNETSATSASDDDAKKEAKTAKAEEQEADDNVSYCQEALKWAIIQRFEAYKNFIECRDLVIKSIPVINIYIFMSTIPIPIHIKEQDCKNDVKIVLINIIGYLLFTKEQRKVLNIY
jgi:hypothetical protein